MSDSQANVPSLSEQNTLEENKEAQVESIASTDTNQQQENKAVEQIIENTTSQPAVEAASEEPQNTSTASQPTFGQAEATIEKADSGEEPVGASEALTNAEMDAEIPTTSDAPKIEADNTVPPADLTEIVTATDTNNMDANSTEKQLINAANDVVPEQSNITVKQEEVQKQTLNLSEPNASEENQAAQAEPTASTDIIQKQEGTDGGQIAESVTNQLPVEAATEEAQNASTLQPAISQPETKLEQADPEEQPTAATETLSNAQMDVEIPKTSTASDLEAKTAATADVTQTGTATDTNHADTNSIEKQHESVASEVVPEQRSFTETQEDPQNQAPEAQMTSIGEGELEQRQVTADALEAAALESQTDGDNHLNGHAAGPSERTAPSARQDEMSRIRKENEDMRLLWLSLPSHDHPSYYSDTDEENASSGSSCAADALLPRSAAGRAPYLNGDRVGEHSIRQKRKQDQWSHDERDDESDLNEEEDTGRDISQNEKQYRIGNRGNKLKKNSRWVRKHKLGTSTDARNEKDITERFTDRLKALQRTQVESMLNNAPGPSLLPIEADMLDGSDRLLLKDIHSQPFIEETSILLAPQLLRPILSTRALLQSHTLRHTFRNPHIGALSRTALDLRESESQISRSLTRCLKAMETRIPNRQLALVNGDSTHLNGTLPSQTDSMPNTRSSDKEMEIDPHAVGVEGTQGTDDELNPSFAQLDRLFVTKEGLPIPFGGQAGEDGEIEMARQGLNGAEQQTILTADQQREVIRAALECLHELGGDSLEYVERLEEVRSRLAAVKQKRLKVWNALRIWALKREGDDFENDSRAGANESDALAEAAAAVATNSSNSRPGTAGQAKTNSTTNASTSGTKRRRVAA